MTIDELNKIVRNTVPGPDWYFYRGARVVRGSSIASDKVMVAKKVFADPVSYEWMENLEASDPNIRTQEKYSEDEMLEHWDQMIDRFAVDELDPVAVFDLSDEDDCLYLFLVLFKNQARDQYVILDGQRYRIFIDVFSHSIDSVYGKTEASPVFAVTEGEHSENVMGALAPVTDQSRKYINKFRQLRPDLGL